MERLTLSVETRDAGKSVARKLRAKGCIPAILYGKRRDPQPLTVNLKDFKTAIRKSPDLTALIDLTINGKERALALVRDYQADCISREFTHLDLQAIDLKEKIEIEVPVKLLGTPVGVKDEGGILEQLRRKIQIKSLPDRIPSSIDIDVSGLHIGQNIHANDIKLPEGVEFLHAQNFAVAAVVAPMKEEVAAPVVAAPVEGEAAAAATPAEGEAKPAGETKKEAAAPAAGDKKKS